MSTAQRRNFRQERLLSVLLMFLCILCAAILVRAPETALTAAETPPKDGGPFPVVPGSAVQRELAPGANDVFTITLEEGKLLRFSIDKGDLLLSTALYGPTGAKLLEHSSQNVEPVQFSLPTQVAGLYRIELQSLEKTQTPRQYELKVEPITNATVLDRKVSEARQALIRADLLCADWTQISFRQAVSQFDRATQLWSSVSDFSSASNATLKSGDVYFLFAEYPEALKRYQNAASLAERAGDWLAKARALSQNARLQSYLGHNDLAEKQLTESLHLFKEHEAGRNLLATVAYGEALSDLAEVTYARGNFLKSSRQFEEAIKSLTNDRKGEARARLFLGYLAGGIGDMDRALKEISRAHELYLEINNKAGEGLALAALALWHSSQDLEKSITFHKEAFEIFHAIGDRYGEAIALNVIGQGYEFLDDQQLALNNYQQALRIYTEIGAVDGISTSTFKIARMHDLAGRFEQALSYYDRSVQISRASGKVRTEGFALNEIATLYVKQGLPEQAAVQYQKILKFFESIGDLRGQATALNSYGDLLVNGGRRQEDLGLYSRAP